MSRDLEALVRDANLVAQDRQLERLFGPDLTRRLLGHIDALKEGPMTDIDQKHDIGEDQEQSAREHARPTDSAPATPQRARRRPEVKPVPALVAGLVIIMLLVPLLMVVSDWRPFTSSQPGPVEIAESYLAARNAYDVEAARALVAAEFRTTEPPDGFTDAVGMELAFAQHRAYGFVYSDIECEPGGDAWTVSCSYLWTTDLHRIGGHPATPERLLFSIEDGRITRVSRVQLGSLTPWWSPFFDDFLREHPEFRMAVDRSLGLDPEAVEAVVELLPQYLELYEEWVGERDA